MNAKQKKEHAKRVRLSQEEIIERARQKIREAKRKHEEVERLRLEAEREAARIEAERIRLLDTPQTVSDAW